MSAIQDYSILITDDDAAVRETLREILVPQGYRTFLAESGEEAIDIVRDNHVHIALLDMNLPRLSGLETLAIFRQMREALPAILISGDCDENLLRRASRSTHSACWPSRSAAMWSCTSFTRRFRSSTTEHADLIGQV